ncbi:hypothetical protein SS50377_28087 [Spironucleus salmonicida]|uniref:Cleavage and polyadenylation specificity factor 100 kDa subunit n=1 Tax=Spironucleus salmonicida TaxID=348837 RepID=V6LED6_9EUKA|nr:hypothetical protein SS50377_28087 [Spironucleus salmonicida]|eukprot:EST42638.1 Hypothetical protein SS50377_17958 [Spironucleus salmonicida]
MSHNPRLVVHEIFQNQGISATILKIKDFQLLINCGIRQPYEQFFEQYKQLAPELSAIIITSPSQLCCGALPFLRHFGYRGQFFIPEFLFEEIRLTIDDMRYQTITDYNNHIPIDEHLQPLFQTDLFSIEQKRDLQLNSWIVLNQQVSVLIIQQSVDQIAINLKTDYFREEIFFAEHLFKTGRHALTKLGLQNLQLAISGEPKKIPALQIANSKQISTSLKNTISQNGQIFIPCDGIGSFLRTYENLQQELKQLNYFKKLKISLICDKAIPQNLKKYALGKSLFTIQKFDDSDVIFSLDATFLSGFSLLFLKEKINNPLNKLIICDLSQKTLESKIFQTLISAKIRGKKSVKIDSYDIEVREVSEKKTRTLRDELQLLNYEVLVEDLQNEHFESKYDVNQVIDMANSVYQFKYEDVYRQEGKFSGKKFLILTKEQKQYIINFIGNKTRDGLFLADFSSPVLQSCVKDEMKMFKIDKYKTYQIEFEQPKERIGFVQDLFQLKFLKFFTELLVEKSYLVCVNNQVTVQQGAEQNLIQEVNKNSIAAVNIPTFKSIFDDSIQVIQRNFVTDFEVEGVENQIQIKKKATGEYIEQKFTINCQIDVFDFDFYHNSSSSIPLLQKIAFNDKKVIVNPTGLEIEKFGSTSRYLMTKIPLQLTYEMFNISHWISLAFSQTSHMQKLILPNKNQVIQVMLERKSSSKLENQEENEDELFEICNKFHEHELPGGVLTVGGDAGAIEQICSGYKLESAVFEKGESWNGELCGVDVKFDDNRKVCNGINVKGRVSGRLMDLIDQLKGEFGGEFAVEP